VMARKAAPIQINWLGYLGPVGLQAIDHTLTDALVDPVDLDDPANRGDEARAPALRLDRTYVCYTPPTDAPPVSSPPMLTRGFPTFGSFNALAKLSEPCLALWCKVLHAVPTARLLIKSKPLRDQGVRDGVLARLLAHGVSAERIILKGWEQETSHHLDVYGEVDVALDSSPFNGVTTTCEASWMGVPVVSLVGGTRASRQGLTLLSALGCREQATHSELDFVEQCRQLVADPARLAEQRAQLREHMRASPLMDGAGFAQSVEACYRRVWQAWCANEA
jgi:protein O-GlcNAc transferase